MLCDFIISKMCTIIKSYCIVLRFVTYEKKTCWGKQYVFASCLPDSWKRALVSHWFYSAAAEEEKEKEDKKKSQQANSNLYCLPLFLTISESNSFTSKGVTIVFLLSYVDCWV